MNRNRKRVAE